MESRTHYSTCNEGRPHLGHQDSRTMLLRDMSVSSDIDDVDVFHEETTSAGLSVRLGSEQGMSSATSFIPRTFHPGTAVGFPRRNSFERRLSNRRSSLPLQNRPLPLIPTPYNNVDHNGVVQNRTARSASVPNDSRPDGSSCCTVRPPLPLNPPPKKASKWHARFNVCFAIFVFILSAGASVLSLSTYLSSCNQGRNSYCLPCSDLTPTPQDKGVSDYQLTTREEGGQKLCCVDSSDGLALLVAQIQQNEKMNYAESQNMTSAHVGLYADSNDRKARSFQIGTHYTLHISREPFLQHCRNVIAGDRTLSILITGRYFVYSSIHFNLNEYDKACRDLEHKTWVHRVYVSRGPENDVTALLRSEHTCCEECHEDRTSGFTGGLFQLIAGDEIFVDVSAPPLVIDSKETSYMGLFLVAKE